MIHYLITRGGVLADGWHVNMFTHGLATNILLLEDVRPMFYASERVLSVPGDARKLS